ncbi:DUF393 domain-containing protein, partial [Mesorhizobium sp. M6A.T.Ce.TU.016.01.1.1]
MTDHLQPVRPQSTRPFETVLDSRHPLIVFDGVCVLCSG